MKLTDREQLFINLALNYGATDGEAASAAIKFIRALRGRGVTSEQFGSNGYQQKLDALLEINRDLKLTIEALKARPSFDQTSELKSAECTIKRRQDYINKVERRKSPWFIAIPICVTLLVLGLMGQQATAQKNLVYKIVYNSFLVDAAKKYPHISEPEVRQNLLAYYSSKPYPLEY